MRPTTGRPAGDVVLVTGGRDFADRFFVFKALDTLHAEIPIRVLVYGMARGADEWGRQWAVLNGVIPFGFKARWETEGMGAGLKRNTRMLVEAQPDVGVAFEGGRGTRDMVKKLKRAGVPVIDLRGGTL